MECLKSQISGLLRVDHDLNMIVVGGYRHKLRQTFAEPHGGVSFHVDSKRFKPFLQPTDGKVAQAADILTQINPSNL